MNLQLVPFLHPIQSIYCYGCKRRIQGAKLYADLDGPAFEAFYCLECAGVLLEEEKKEESK